MKYIYLLTILSFYACSSTKKISGCSDGDPRFINYKENPISIYEKDISNVNSLTVGLNGILSNTTINSDRKKKIRAQIEELDQFTATFYYKTLTDFELYKTDPCDRAFKETISERSQKLAFLRTVINNESFDFESVLNLFKESGLTGNKIDIITEKTDELIKIIN